MLSHEDPNTTQFYTYVVIHMLQAIYQATCPSCQTDQDAEAVGGAAAQDKTTPS